MIRFQIPKPYISGFETLLSIDNEQVGDLVAFLKSVPIGTGPKDFVKLFFNHFTEKNFVNRQLASTLYSLGGFVLNVKSDVSNDELVSSLINSYKEQEQIKDFSEEKERKFESTLKDILKAIDPLKFTFKAFELLAENERVVRDGHIITDIRLLFKQDIADSLGRYGVVKHQLKLQVEENGEALDYYFTLSNTDLQKLQDQISRALEKEKVIRSDYQPSISFIDITE